MWNPNSVLSQSPFPLCLSWPSKRFLRCSPFDEFSLWKSQVDNGSMKGGERLSILTKSLLLRRTKDQLDSTGKPLVTRFLPIPWGARGKCDPHLNHSVSKPPFLLRRLLRAVPGAALTQSFPGKRGTTVRRPGQRASLLGVL